MKGNGFRCGILKHTFHYVFLFVPLPHSDVLSRPSFDLFVIMYSIGHSSPSGFLPSLRMTIGLLKMPLLY